MKRALIGQTGLMDSSVFSGKGNKKRAVIWVIAPCSLVEVYQRFKGPRCLRQQGDDGGGIKDL
jgi:hypothetical protein